MTNQSPLTSHLSPVLHRWQRRTFILGIVAAVLSLIGATFDRPQFFHSYLFAWLFWIGLSLGALVIVMMQALTGGKWGAAIRNVSTAAFMTLPLMALLFLPVLFGAHQIYGWSMGALGEAPGYHHKEQWLNLPFFVGRSVFYFVVLTIIALFVRRWQKSGAAPQLSAMSAGGLIAYVLCMNFACRLPCFSHARPSAAGSGSRSLPFASWSRMLRRPSGSSRPHFIRAASSSTGSISPS